MTGLSLSRTRGAGYATARTKDHLRRFSQLDQQLCAEQIDLDFLGECEERANLFPDLNWRYYAEQRSA